jgi:subtilisin family serine protease
MNILLFRPTIFSNLKMLIMKSKFSLSFIGLLILLFSFSCQKGTIESGGMLTPESSTTAFISGAGSNYIVITKSETLPDGFEAKLAAFGEIVNSIPEIGQVVVKPKVANFESKVTKLTQVLAVVPDLKMRWIDPTELATETSPQSIGDDETRFYLQWGMDAIDAPEAWDAGFTGEGTRVFILDSGIDADNPDLDGNLNTELSTSFVPEENYYVRAGRFFSHGTHVSGIIAAEDNDWGVIGVAPYAEIVMVKVLSEYTGSGDFSWVNAGIVYAADNGADVINMSLGATFYRNGFYIDDEGVVRKIPAAYIQFDILAQQRAVNYAIKKGAVIITSAGNDGINFDGGGSLFKLPAGLEKVIAVSATAPYNWINNPGTDLDLPASYTDYGRSLVELAAPGGDAISEEGYPYDMVLSCGTGDYPVYSLYFSGGTSMAAPHVAGVAALIIGKNGGQMAPDEVREQLILTADKIDGDGISPYYGFGRVNAYRAVTE